MPCDTVSTAKVKLNASTIDRALLDKAMATLGFGMGTYTLNSNGEITTYGGVVTPAEVNKAYSKQVVTSQAKRFGWSVKEQADGQLLIQKASF